MDPIARSAKIKADLFTVGYVLLGDSCCSRL